MKFSHIGLTMKRLLNKGDGLPGLSERLKHLCQSQERPAIPGFQFRRPLELQLRFLETLEIPKEKRATNKRFRSTQASIKQIAVLRQSLFGAPELLQLIGMREESL